MGGKGKGAGRGGSGKAAFRAERVTDKDIEIRLKEMWGEFLARVTARMERRGITRAELAARLGVSRVFVTQLFSGKSNPTLRTLAALTEALECDLALELRRRRVLIPSGGKGRAAPRVQP